MRPIRPSFLTALVLSLALADAATVFAQSYPEPIEIDAKSGITYGNGYDTRRKAFLKQCVEVEKDAPKMSSGQPLSDSKFQLVTSNSDVVNKMQLSVEASFSALVGGGKLSLSSKNSLVHDTKTNRYNLSLLAYSYQYSKPQFLKVAQLKLLPEYKEMLDKGQKNKFRAACGDVFVFGLRRGREFYGTVSVDNQDMKSWSKFNTENNVNYKNATIQANLDVNFSKSIENSFKATSIKVNARSNIEGMKNPTTVDEVVEIFQGFNSLKGGEADIKFHLISYQALSDVDVEDPLDLNRIEVQQNYLVTALWDLKAMQDDAGFILQHRDMFALGTAKAQQNKRFDDVRTLQKRWGDEFWKLQASTKACMNNFTDACQNLADRYQQRGIDLVAERALLPERYSSDCYGANQLEMSTVMDKFFAMGDIQMGRHDQGDSDMGGGPVRAQSWLRTVPDGTQLKAQYEVTLEEWKTKKDGSRDLGHHSNTRFHFVSPEQVVFDLSGMTNIGLKQCAFSGIGIKDSINDPSGKPVAGYTDATSGKDPRGVIPMTTGTQGALASLRCILDVKGGEDNKLSCQKPDVRNRNLALVNTLDLKADGWSVSSLPDVDVQQIKEEKKRNRDDDSADTEKRKVKTEDMNDENGEHIRKKRRHRQRQE